jgi:hypothetical protein
MDRVVVATAYEIRKHHGLGWKDVEDTLRGLEDYFLETPKTVARKTHAMRILMEQERQRDLDMRDHEGLGDLARESSLHDRVKAVVTGANDARAAVGKFTYRP